MPTVMKKSILLLIALLMVSHSLSAQLEFSWGIRGGADMTSLSSDKSGTTYDPVIGYYGGAQFITHFSPSTRMSIGLTLSKEGADYTYKADGSKGKIDLTYMKDEMVFESNVSRRFVADYGLSIDIPYSGKSKPDNGSSTDFSENMPILQLSIVAGCGVLIGKHIWIQLRMYPLSTKIRKDINEKIRRQDIQLGLMYAF